MLRERGRRLIAAAIAVVVGASALTAISAATETEPAQAAVASQFNPGNIISDAVFYNSSSMSAAQIQGFLDAKVAACASGYTCLESYRENTWTRAATQYCAAYTGGNQSAAEIIAGVAKACGINPQVLMVILQKEQGLITKTAPSQAVYDRAMGYGCPDTAPCNAEYFGFYNQVYLGARQYKIYQALPNNFGYRAGRANTIKWHPNAACGTSSVYIENQATAGLYNYTPYRPNAAAMANIYGTGDACSSYGNRNFWRYFSDWFGNPQGGGSFVKSADSATIYLVTAASKHRVPDGQSLNSLYAMGPFRVVAQEYLDSFATGIDTGQLLRDPTTGEIFFVGEGVRNRFDSCEMLSEYGGTCAAEPGKRRFIDVTPTQIAAFALGPPVSRFVHSISTGQIYYVDDGIKRGVPTFAKITELAAGGATTWISHSQYALDSIATGPDFVDPGQVVTTAGSAAQYLVDGANELWKFSSNAYPAEFGRPTPTSVSAQTITGMTLGGTELGLAVSCSGVDYVAGAGLLWKTASTGGLTVTSLEPSTCAVLTPSAQSITGALFYRAASSGFIYYIADGKKHFVTSMASVYSLNGANPLVLVPISQPAADAIPNGPDVFAPATLAKAASTPTIYLIDGASTKVPIATWPVAAEFGFTGFATGTDAGIAAYTTAPAPLGLAVSCASTVYLAGQGKLWQVPTAGGLPTTALDPATCLALAKSPTPVTGAVFYRVVSSGFIYSIANGQKQFMASMAAVNALNGANPLVLVPVSQGAIDSIPTAPEVLGTARMVKTASSPTIFFLDGANRKIPVSTFAVPTELGVSTFSTVSEASLAGYTTASAPLTLAVTCGASTLVGGGGKLWKVPSAFGLPTTAFADATCAALTTSTTEVTGALFYRVATTGYIYYIANGQKQFVQSMGSVTSLNGSHPLVLVPISQAAVNTIPSGAAIP